MQAEDTVLELKQLTEVRTAYPANEVSKAQMVADQKKIKEQAEISFSLGEQQGVRKVVEWIKENHEEIVNGWEGKNELIGLDIDPDKWRAKLEEWGIK